MAHGKSLKLKELRSHPRIVYIGPAENRAAARSVGKTQKLKMAIGKPKKCEACGRMTVFIAKSKANETYARICLPCFPKSRAL